MENKKCKRYIESKGVRCGGPAKRRMVRKQCVGTFCFPCWIEVMETLPLKEFFGFTPPPGSPIEARALEAVRVKIDGLRKMWYKEVEKYRVMLKNAG